VTTSTRDAGLAEVPTIAEAGVAGYEAASWSGLFAPAGTPAATVERIAQEIQTMASNPEVKRRLASLSASPGGSTPAQFAAFVKRDYDAIGQLVREQGLKAEGD